MPSKTLAITSACSKTEQFDSPLVTDRSKLTHVHRELCPLMFTVILFIIVKTERV